MPLSALLPLELGWLTERSLQLCEAGEASERLDAVPEVDRLLATGHPGDHRAEERWPVRRPEGQNRCADVFARASEGIFAVGAHDAVPIGVVGRVGERRLVAEFLQYSRDCGPVYELFPPPVHVDPCSDCGVVGTDDLRAFLCAQRGRDSEKSQAHGVELQVPVRELAVVVPMLVEDPQADEPPLDVHRLLPAYLLHPP